MLSVSRFHVRVLYCASSGWQGCRVVLQVFMVKPDSLQPTTYYIGVFNMDYYIHQPFSYTLRVSSPLSWCEQHKPPSMTGAA